VTTHPGASQKEIVAHVQATVPSDGRPMSYAGVVRWIRKFEDTKITPTHLVRAFGTSLNPNVDPKDVQETAVSLIVREADPANAHIVRYTPTDILYDVVKAFLERRPDLGIALTELTRLQVHRRAPANTGASTPVPTTPKLG